MNEVGLTQSFEETKTTLPGGRVFPEAPDIFVARKLIHQNEEVPPPEAILWAGIPFLVMRADECSWR